MRRIAAEAGSDSPASIPSIFRQRYQQHQQHHHHGLFALLQRESAVFDCFIVDGQGPGNPGRMGVGGVNHSSIIVYVILIFRVPRDPSRFATYSFLYYVSYISDASTLHTYSARARMPSSGGRHAGANTTWLSALKCNVAL
jgi:hypothetical protein